MELLLFPGRKRMLAQALFFAYTDGREDVSPI